MPVSNDQFVSTNPYTAAEAQAVAQAINGSGYLAPVRVATTTETLTITAGSVTAIAGTTIDGVTVANNDRVLIPNAPASTGAAGGAVMSSQPGNGVYYIVSGAGAGPLVTARVYEMGGSTVSNTVYNPSAWEVTVTAGTVWDSQFFVVTSPNQPGGAMTYGSTAIQWGIAASRSLDGWGFATQNSSGTPFTLTAASVYRQAYTGSTIAAVTFPTTGVPAGFSFHIDNDSSALLTVKASAGSTILIMGAFTSAIFWAEAATPTLNTQWDYLYGGVSVASGKVATISQTITLAGTDAQTYTFPTTSATIARTDAANTFTGVQTMTSPALTTPTIKGYTETVQAAFGTLTSSKTIPALSNGTICTCTLTAATLCTFTMPTAAPGNSFMIAVTQAATPTATMAFTGVVWPLSGTPVLTATTSYTDLIMFVCWAGTTWHGSYVQGYAT